MAMNYVQLILTLRKNFREMSNDMPLASNEESTTGSASHLNELIQYTDKREKLQEERFFSISTAKD